ncbi:saccharopine dehydrogenase related protein [Agrilactobacillus composti DSM 18527 = JCM 14202]|uniref:Saccharopine dehydrogenase related protein n=1 Tax=Agrilactobacillus composti DSM 18527 = JCM 14202 TaxID=1423734 RepID=X0PGX1_9LACO|nr:SDR family oxidoreductase [Agrilactobacillus composti]KRM34640.1 saccharopine dehydrogenase related protein [Agrilactobacillus composti DSM 18527 = JCM 14202]GAF41193.1 oxidoreductase [Agrilactobacillus composti DSM 18527 = JCM 14202]
MTNVLILGANGQIARQVIAQLKSSKAAMKLTLFLRNADRIKDIAPADSTIIDGDTTDTDALKKAMKGQDVVYANLAGSNIEAQAKDVVSVMDALRIKRLIWISTLGIYDEVPGKFGEWNNKTLGSYIQNYAAAAQVIEHSDLDYTLVRPAWLTNKDEIDYETTEKSEEFKGTEVSRKSVANFVVHLIQEPNLEVKHSVGVNKPNTDGDKPAWY